MNNVLEEQYFKRIQKVCLIQVIFNYLLTIIKFIGGFIGHSSSLINDGINSLGDVVTSQVSFFASKASSKKADNNHHFGHAKIESLFCLIFSTVLICLTIFLMYDSINSLINKEYLDADTSNIIYALAFAVVALVIKGMLFSYTFINYKKTKSVLLKTQSLDHLSDSVSTFISLISILVIMFTNNDYLNMIDPICSLIIGLLIIFGAIKILIENSSLLLDKAPDNGVVEKIKKDINSFKEVDHIDAFRARMVGNRIFIEVEISLDGNMSLFQAHEIADNIRLEVLKNHEEVKHILVHVNPLNHKEENDF